MQRDSFEVRRFPSLEAYTGDEPGALAVLIATEEILGPVRNGGIASTYYHLARGLAAQGHKVSVLYLKGRQVENKTPEHWIEHFAEFGIELVYLEAPDQQLFGAAIDWQARHYAFYLWLKANDRFAVVHTSEWRGGAFCCLAAKRLGLAFRDTLFIVKTSSPYIWNRHYQMRPIDRRDLLAAAFTEQKCVEWADMVVGGSAHLLSFMAHIGYRLPEGHCFVQPNIVDFAEVKVVDRRPPRAPGDVVATRELVFFGRLEPRKGLELFCAAIDALVARGVVPERVTFLGKEGERLANRDGIKPIAFIEAHAAQWPIAVDIVTDHNQPEALSLMCARDMIAVMPSLIENSTMAVYETLVHRIPFVATAVGGTPELIDPADHAASLVAPDALTLADRLEAMLRDGQPIARAAFDNDANLAIWYGFHRYLAAHGPAALAGEQPRASPHDRVTRIVYPQGPAELAELTRAIAAGGAPEFDETIICLGFLLDEATRAMIVLLEDRGIRLLEAVGASQGEAFDLARAEAGGSILLFDALASARFERGIAATLKAALAARPNDLVGFAFRFDPASTGRRDAVFLPLGGDIASHHVGNDAYGLELVAGRRETFEALGGFEPYAVGAGILHECVSRAIAGGRDYLIAPEPLVDFPGDLEEITRRNANYEYLKDKALLEGASLAMRKIWLYRPRGAGGAALGEADTEQSDGASAVPALVRASHRGDDGAVWLGDIARFADPALELPPRGRILLGIDRVAGRLRAGALHQARLVIHVNDAVLRDDPDFGARGEITTFALDLAPLLAETDRLRVRIALRRGAGERVAVVIVQRVEPDVYLVTSADSIFWDSAFDQALALLGSQDRRPRTRRERTERAARAPADTLVARLRARLAAFPDRG